MHFASPTLSLTASRDFRHMTVKDPDGNDLCFMEPSQ